jgi:RNA polymerase sigma-70 factor, ECF subfamily
MKTTMAKTAAKIARADGVQANGANIQASAVLDSRQDDAILVRRLAAKEPLALADFQRRYSGLITATARAIVRNDWDTEEVVQDVLWTVFRKADSFRGEAGLSTWVYRITQNAARMLLRKRKRIATPVEDGALDALVHAAHRGADWHHPDAQAQGNRALRNLISAADALPVDNRALFIAMDLYDTPREEVAAQMGITVSALKARLHRVRKTLRDATVSAPPMLPDALAFAACAA